MSVLRDTCAHVSYCIHFYSLIIFTNRGHLGKIAKISRGRKFVRLQKRSVQILTNSFSALFYLCAFSDHQRAFLQERRVHTSVAPCRCQLDGGRAEWQEGNISHFLR